MTTYPYERAYRELFDTEIGRDTLEAVVHVVRELNETFSMTDAINAALSRCGCVDTWHVQNAVDHMLTLGEIRELTNRDEVPGQDRRFVRED